jgi:S1-C subfamily serine protease
MEFMSRRIDWKIAVVVLVVFTAGLLTGSAFTGKTVSGSPATPSLTPSEAPEQAINAEISFQNGFAPIVAKGLPALVNISSSKIVRSQTMPLFDDPFFQQFFGRQFQIPREQRAKSLGSGVIVNPDGYILTNNHVVEGATEITVAFGDRREFQAKTVGTDPRTDIAVLKFVVVQP